MHEAFPEINNSLEDTNDPDARVAQEPNRAAGALTEANDLSSPSREGKAENSQELRSLIKRAFMEPALQPESQDRTHDNVDVASDSDLRPTSDPSASHENNDNLP